MQQTMQHKEECDDRNANERRSPGPLPIQNLINIAISQSVESTTGEINDREADVDESDRETQPKVAYGERYSDDEEVQEHQSTVEDVGHDVEEVHVVDFRVMDRCPVGDGDTQGQRCRDVVQEPVGSFELVGVTTVVQVQSAQLPGPGDEDQSQKRLEGAED